jgi:Zn-dependent protease with chaperone function
MVEYAAQSIIHSVVAVLVVAALLRLWRIDAPDVRVAFRLLPLFFPLVVLPAFLVLAKVRETEVFQDRWALFSGGRWGGARAAALALAAALGTGLFLLDLVRFLSRERAARRPGATPGAGDLRDLGEEIERLARSLGVEPPRLVVLDTGSPILRVAGVRRPALIVSAGTLARLAERERRAALTHELAHVARRDPLLGWVLMGCSVAAFFNPVVHVAVRLVLRELEWRADDLAVAAGADAPALASALSTLVPAPDGATHARPAGLLARGRAAVAATRRRRLLGPRPPGAITFPRLGVAMTGVTLGLLLFFVV